MTRAKLSTVLQFGFSRLDKQILALDFHQPGTHRLTGRSAEYGAGRHVELTAVAGTRHYIAIQFAHRERAPRMRTCVIEGMQIPARTRNVYLGSRDIEDPHLARSYILRITDSYKHVFTSYAYSLIVV